MGSEIQVTPFRLPDINKLFAVPNIPNFHNNPAKSTYECLGKLIKNFEEKLDDDHEIGLRLVSFGNGGVYRVANFAYVGPDIIIFHCLAQDGTRADLIQNTSQLNFLLLAVPKIGESPRRIGFDVP